MKVKVALKFRGREMAHTEVGFEVIKKFIADIEPYGHPDFTPKLIGKAINLMISPLPRNKRAKNPRGEESAPAAAPEGKKSHEPKAEKHAPKAKVVVAEEPQSGGLNNPFASLDIQPGA